jgi:hypothetical protein
MADLHLEQKDGYVMGHELGYVELYHEYVNFYKELGREKYLRSAYNWDYNHAKNFRIPQSAAEAVRKGFDHSKTTEGVEYWKGVMDELEELVC